MKRTFSGSRAGNAPGTANTDNHNLHLPTVKIEIPSIPLEARKHIKYLSQYPSSHVYQWIELWKGFKAREDNTSVSRSCCLQQKCSDLPWDESDNWTLGIAQDAHVKSEQSQFFPLSALNQHDHDLANLLQISVQAQGRRSSITTPHHVQQKHVLRVYACSFCDKTFGRKGVWKRHEESLHEPQKQWYCRESGCNRKFTAGDKLRQHHKTDHGCENCKHDKDANVVSNVQTKCAWGCGFCVKILTTWDERVKHIGRHFDNGSKRSDWDFSRVVQGLLRQPKVYDAWQSLLHQFHGRSVEIWPYFRWSVDSSQGLLQSLQSSTSEQSAVDIAQSAYNLLLPGLELGSDVPAAYDSFDQLVTCSPAQDFPFDSFNHDDALPIHANGATINEDFQSGQSLFTVGTETGGNLDAYGGYVQDSKDYTTPCAETFEPAAWTLWPYTDEVI